jgi:hypothetical protein
MVLICIWFVPCNVGLSTKAYQAPQGRTIPSPKDLSRINDLARGAGAKGRGLALWRRGTCPGGSYSECAGGAC